MNTDIINWAADGWFKANHAHLLTEEFKQWWINYYGMPEQYVDEHEYWVRCAFSFQAWTAAKEHEGQN